MNYDMYNNAELIRMVDNKPDATDMERALATRLDEVMMEVKLITPRPDPKQMELNLGAPQ